MAVKILIKRKFKESSCVSGIEQKDICDAQRSVVKMNLESNFINDICLYYYSYEI